MDVASSGLRLTFTQTPHRNKLGGGGHGETPLSYASGNPMQTLFSKAMTTKAKYIEEYKERRHCE